MDVLKDLINDIVALEILETELTEKKELQEKQLTDMMPKNVGSVSYDKERVMGGMVISEEKAIMDLAKATDNINKIEDIISILQHKISNKRQSIDLLLTEEERRIFRARFIDGKMIYEIADINCTTERTIYRKINIIKDKISQIDKRLEKMS